MKETTKRLFCVTVILFLVETTHNIFRNVVKSNAILPLENIFFVPPVEQTTLKLSEYCSIIYLGVVEFFSSKFHKLSRFRTSGTP